MKEINMLRINIKGDSELGFKGEDIGLDYEILLNPAIDHIKIKDVFYKIKKRCFIANDETYEISNELIICVEKIGWDL